MPCISSGTPAPVAAEPAYTGCSSPAAVCAATPRRSRRAERPRPSTYAARRASSCSASTSVSRSRKPTSSARYAVNPAARLPASWTAPIGRMSGLSRFATDARTASTSAPVRSTLLTNSRVGTCRRCSARIRIRVCGCTPSTADSTRTAPSSTTSERSTSAMKSGWPGVSTTLTVRSPSGNATTAARMVMPRRRSSVRVSVWVVPESTDPGRSMTPARCRSRSVSVVLPASTCARMPRLSERAGTRDPLEVVGAELGGHTRSSHLLASSGISGRAVPVAATVRRTGAAPPRVFHSEAGSPRRVGGRNRGIHSRIVGDDPAIPTRRTAPDRGPGPSWWLVGDRVEVTC